MSVNSSFSLEGSKSSLERYVLGFAAGFVAVLVFHQGMLTFLHAIGIAPIAPFPMHPTWPFGVPQVWSLAFWGGLWGVLFAAVESAFPRGNLYWAFAVLFGAIGPTLVAWFVVFPLKGIPVAGGWHAARVVTGLLVNGAWGGGTALLFRARRTGALVWR
jgi:hypothetical protein